MSDDLETAGRYLRGELSESRLAQFEERLLSDGALHVTVRAAEDELIEDYALGRLGGAARARVRARLGVDRELRERLGVIAALRQRAARDPAPRAPHRGWLVAPVLAAAAAAAIALAVWPRSEAASPIAEFSLAAPTRGHALPVLRLAPVARTVRLGIAPGSGFALRGPRGPVPMIVRGPTVIELDAAALVDGMYELTTGDAAVSYQLRVVREGP